VTGTLWPRAAALFLAGVLGFGVGAVTWATTHQAMPMPMPVAPAVNDAEVEVRAVELINAARLGSGLTSLAWEPDLAALAKWRSQDMAARAYFGHWASEQDPTIDEPVAFVVASGWGMPYQRMGEVLVRVPQGVLDPARVGTDAWAASPPHAAVEFDPALGYVGVGAARDSLGREYLTGVIGG
jgi:uncharacterized protein YkwD